MGIEYCVVGFVSGGSGGGGGLYAVPFKLDRIPSAIWADAFVKTWNSPPEWTSQHCPGIARVSGDTIVLDGTTIEEIKKTHKVTLETCVSEANRIEAEHLQKEEEHNQKIQERSSEFRRRVQEEAKGISFE